MNAQSLLDTLAGLGVVVTLSPAGKLRLEPASGIPAELLADVREHKGAVLAHLYARQDFAPLPEPLARMVRAAAVGHLRRVTQLENGLVPDLGEYVLTWAATYATGGDLEHTLFRLWTAHAAWQP